MGSYYGEFEKKWDVRHAKWDLAGILFSGILKQTFLGGYWARRFGFLFSRNGIKWDNGHVISGS